MESASSSSTPPSALDERGLCLLSLDGGGVRGLSSLYVLRRIMDDLNDERKKDGLPARKPCEVFDLIGGTSTGGLIAIMLGRLEMDVGECITAYSKLSESVFSKQIRRSRFSIRGAIKPRFDSNKLKEVIDGVIRDRGEPFQASDLFNDKQERGCKVFVCATSTDPRSPQRLRSYDLPKKRPVSATITEVALATSAATGFFPPVTIGNVDYVDGALGANNPVNEVEGEASDIWCPETGDLKPLVRCFISIGTGTPGLRSVSDHLPNFVSKTLVSLATETEDTAATFVRRWRQHYDQSRYFRFNVEQGLQDVGLAEHQKHGRIEVATNKYLEQMAEERRLEKCVKSLKGKHRVLHRKFPLENGQILLIAMKQGIPTRIFSRLLMHMQVPYILEVLPPKETHCSRTKGHPGQCVQEASYSGPPTKTRHFVGRTKTIDKLFDMLFGEEPCPRVALFGLGGVGKTQTALQLAQRAEEVNPEISMYWVSVLSASSFEQSYAVIATKLGIKMGGGDANSLVREFLSSKRAGPWLLIVDNADDEELVRDIDQHLPESADGRILFTTRSKKIAMSVSQDGLVDLHKMDPNEARMFLEKSIHRNIPPQDGVVVKELLEELTHLPLAIAQAAAYIQQNSISITEYLQLLRGTEQDMVELLSEEFHDRTRYGGSHNAVATTWIVSFNQIRNTDAAAARLLRFISCIEPKAIPRSILPGQKSEAGLTRAIGTLCMYTFLVRRGDQAVYDMHSLVHLATRIWVRESGLASQTTRDAYDHLYQAYPRKVHEDRALWREYLPHALSLFKSDEQTNTEESVELRCRVGRCLTVDGRRREAVECLESACRLAHDHLPEDDRTRLNAEFLLSDAYKRNMQLQEAFRLIHHVAGVQERILSENDPWRLETLTWLASLHTKANEPEKGREILENVVELQRPLPEDDAVRLASEHELGVAYSVNGQSAEAIKLLQYVFAIRTKTLAEDHENLLATGHELGVAYSVNGQSAEAIKLLQHVFAIRTRTLAEDHPDRLASDFFLGISYYKGGQKEKAAEILRHVATVERKKFPGDHPDLQSTERWLRRCMAKE